MGTTYKLFAPGNRIYIAEHMNEVKGKTSILTLKTYFKEGKVRFTGKLLKTTEKQKKHDWYEFTGNPKNPLIESSQDKIIRPKESNVIRLSEEDWDELKFYVKVARGEATHPNPLKWKTNVDKGLGLTEISDKKESKPAKTKPEVEKSTVEKKPAKEKVLKKKPVKEELVKIDAKEIKAIHEEDNYLSRRCIYSSVTTDSTKANSVGSLFGAEKRLFEKGALEYDAVSKKYNLTENGKIHSNLHVYLSKALYKGNFKKVAREIEEFLEARM